MSTPLDSELRENLRRLARIDPGELRLIKYYVRWRWLRYRFRCLPFPAKFAVVNSALLPIILILAPPPGRMPAIGIPVFFGGSYCISLMIAALLPHRREEKWAC